MKYTTEEGLKKLRAIAERAYVRGSETCKVSPIALLAVLDEIKAVEHSVQRTDCPVCRGRGHNVDWNKNVVKCSSCNGTGISR